MIATTRIAAGTGAETRTMTGMPTMTRVTTTIVAVAVVAVVMTMVTKGMSGPVRAAIATTTTIVVMIGIVVGPAVVMRGTTPTRIGPVLDVVTKTRRTTVDPAARVIGTMTVTTIGGVIATVDARPADERTTMTGEIVRAPTGHEVAIVIVKTTVKIRLEAA